MFNSAPRGPTGNFQAPVGTYSPPPGPPPPPQLSMSITRSSDRPKSPEASTTLPPVNPPIARQDTGSSRPPSQGQYQPPQLAPAGYVVPSSPPPSSPPPRSNFASSPPPQNQAPPQPLSPPASNPPALDPPRLNMGILGSSGSGGGPPSPSLSTPGKISASAFRRPFGKKSTTGLSGVGPEKDGLAAGPPYSNILAGEPPSNYGSDYNTTNNVSSTSLGSTGIGGSVSPLNIRSKPRPSLPITPHPPSALPPGAQPPRPQASSNLSTLTDSQGFYTPNEGPTPGSKQADYYFQHNQNQHESSQEGGPGSTRFSIPPPYAQNDQQQQQQPGGVSGYGGANISDIPDEAEFMRELERGEHA